jgi:hypothetical protein
MNLEQGGKVTSHLVKYSHHPTGLALFSQDGKIRSEIRRQAVELNRQEGHLFTVLINGLSAFERAQGRKDEAQTPKRTVVTFALPATSASIGTLKIVGRWYDVNRLRFAEPTPSAGPFIPTERGLMAAVLANPAATRHVLLVTCEMNARLGEAAEMLMFFGGFDPREVMDDTSRDAGCLAFMYPASDIENLKQKLGSVDFR